MATVTANFDDHFFFYDPGGPSAPLTIEMPAVTLLPDGIELYIVNFTSDIVTPINLQVNAADPTYLMDHPILPETTPPASAFAGVLMTRRVTHYVFQRTNLPTPRWIALHND